MGIRKTPRPAGAVRPCGCGGVPGSSPCAPGAPHNPHGSGRDGSSGSGGRRVPHPGPALLRVAAGHPSRPPRDRRRTRLRRGRIPVRQRGRVTDRRTGFDACLAFMDHNSRMIRDYTQNFRTGFTQNPVDPPPDCAPPARRAASSAPPRAALSRVWNPTCGCTSSTSLGTFTICATKSRRTRSSIALTAMQSARTWPRSCTDTDRAGSPTTASAMKAASVRPCSDHTFSRNCRQERHPCHAWDGRQIETVYEKRSLM